MEWTKEIKDKIEKLDRKYASIGQDLPAYLDGLLYANPLNYWDYTWEIEAVGKQLGLFVRFCEDVGIADDDEMQEGVQ